MAEVKELTIPLRAAWKVPRTNRAKRAMAEVRIHVSRHMKKTDEEEIWIIWFKRKRPNGVFQ